jgi:hypothetical protein
VQVNSAIERLRSLEDGREARVIQIQIVRVRVQDEPIQTQRVDGPLHFLCSLTRILRGEACQSSVAARMTRNHRGEIVIGRRCEFACLRRLEHLNAWNRHGQDVHIDACLIHLAKTFGIHIEQLTTKAILVGAGARVIENRADAGWNIEARFGSSTSYFQPRLDEFRRGKRLFRGDSPHRSAAGCCCNRSKQRGRNQAACRATQKSSTVRAHRSSSAGCVRPFRDGATGRMR